MQNRNQQGAGVKGKVLSAWETESVVWLGPGSNMGGCDVDHSGNEELCDCFCGPAGSRSPCLALLSQVPPRSLIAKCLEIRIHTWLFQWFVPITQVNQIGEETTCF